jgi:hypothetical protein
MKNELLNGSQLELGLAIGKNCRTVESSRRGAGRASWWFERMRQLVDRATDWEPAPPPRPEQISFSGPARQGMVPLAAPANAVKINSDEREICE